MQVIILAAGKSSRIFKKIKKNKCLLKINNKTIIERNIDIFLKQRIKKISICTGFRSKNIKNHLKKKKINFIFNKNYNKSDMMESLALSLKKNFDDTIVCYADIIFEKKIIIDLLNTVQKNNNIIVPGLKNWKHIWKIRSKNNYDFESFKNKGKKLIEIGKENINEKDVSGQFMGIFFIPKTKISSFLEIYKSKTNKIQTTSFINHLIKKGNYIQTYIKKYNWFEFDDYEDYENFKKNDFSKLFKRY